MIRLIAIIILCLGLAGCGGSAHDARLSRIADSLDANPHGALAALDSIDASRLSESDRHYYDLLTVKSRDKAYVTHTSDSLILSVMQYYEHHDTDLYPEALYYGGRVYSDLGDFPTALRYFQDALSVTPDDNLDLLGRLYSQTGRLHNTLRQFHQAIPYIEKSLHLDSIQKDTFGLAYDHQLIGFIYKNLGDYDTASKYFVKSIEFGQFLLDEDLADLEIERAGIEIKRGNTSSALKIIRPLMPKIRGPRYALALSYASEIYYTAGIYDTAYLYARELSHQALLNNRKNGFYFLFQPELFRQIPKDSVNIYIKEYHLTIEEYLNKVDRQSVIQQNANYNYRVHERARTEAEQSNIWLERTISLILFVLLISICIIFFLKYRNSKNIISLKEAQREINNLRQKLADAPMKKEDIIIMRENLKEKLLNILSKAESVRFKSPEIKELSASVFNGFDKSQYLGDNHPIWNEIKNQINLRYPNFYKHIEILTLGKISNLELQILELIKCGLTPTVIKSMLGKSIGTISSHRINLCLRMFDERVGNTQFDFIIRLL